MYKFLSTIGMLFVLSTGAAGKDSLQPSNNRGSCEFLLRLTAGLICTTEWDTFSGWLGCMQDGMNEFGFTFNQDYFLRTKNKDNEQILKCKKSVECSYQLPKSIEYCRSPEIRNIKDWKGCVAEQIEKADVGLRLNEDIEFSEKDGFACKQDRR